LRYNHAKTQWSNQNRISNLIMPNPRILVVDDEPSIVKSIKAYLQAEGFDVHTASDGASALKGARTFHPDLIVLDVMLPGMDGLEVLRQLRRESNVYVLMLTAKSTETDKVIGLGVGADDYMTKPFGQRELTARIKAILRRGHGDTAHDAPLVFRHVRIEPTIRRVWKADVLIELTPIEFDLLYALVRHRGRMLTREQLIEQVWGHDYYGDERVVDVHIRRIRMKIEDEPTNPTLVITVRGAGYHFEDESV
jgi:two-component system alkaline phosphatase synthesis response regulator PhoP